MEITKEDYLAIRNDNTRDVMPVLHAYHNFAITKNQKRLSFDEFLGTFSLWLQNPVIYISSSSIIRAVFNKMDRYFGIEEGTDGITNTDC